MAFGYSLSKSKVKTKEFAVQGYSGLLVRLGGRGFQAPAEGGTRKARGSWLAWKQGKGPNWAEWRRRSVENPGELKVEEVALV